jgi:hypothetical protein
MMSFKAVAGAATVQVLPAHAARFSRSNLYMKVEVRSSNNEVDVITTQLGLGIQPVQFTIPEAGIYYVSVAGVGQSDPATPPRLQQLWQPRAVPADTKLLYRCVIAARTECRQW